VLKSLKNGRFYIGSTSDLERRLKEHFGNKSKYTRETGPYKIVFSQIYETLHEARRAEKWLKSLKDRSFIVRIIQSGRLEKKF